MSRFILDESKKEEKKLDIITKRPFNMSDVTFWTNPKDDTVNAIVEYKGKKSRLRASMLVIKGDKILLGKEAHDDHEFSLPGGGFEEGEADIDAATRETEEEVNDKVKEVMYTGIDYCERHDEPMQWVKDNIPEKYWWYNYYTCLCIGMYDGKYEGKVDEVDQDPNMKKTSKFYPIDEVIDLPEFKEPWRIAIKKYLKARDTLNEDWLSRDYMIGELRKAGFNYNFDKYTDEQIYYIYQKNKDRISSYRLYTSKNNSVNNQKKSTIVKPVQNSKPVEITGKEESKEVEINGNKFEVPVWNFKKITNEDLKDDTEEHFGTTTQYKPHLTEDTKNQSKYSEYSKNRIEKLLNTNYNIAVEDVLGYIYDICNDNNLDITIIGADFTGSRRFGNPKQDSDLDFVFTYKSNYDRIKEDYLFNLINEQKLTYKGYTLDINPIEDSDIKQYIQTASQYKKLQEDTRNQLLTKSRSAGPYKDPTHGKNRFERKKYSKIATTVKQYNNLDMNSFFKQDILFINIPVTGETSSYEVTFKIEGVLAEIAKNIKSNDNKFEYKTVIQALTKVFNSGDVYVKCTCEDFCYRFAHWSIVNNYGVDDSSKDPGPGRGIANPLNDKGNGCKHILLALNNADWIMKVASCIKNYILYMEEHMPDAFKKVIFPKLYGCPISGAEEAGLIGEDTNLESDKHVIETINDWARNRGKFVKSSNINPVYANRLEKEQKA